MTMTRVSRPATGRNITGARTELKPQLSDEQWLLIKDLFPEPPVNTAGGRPRVAARECLEGILWGLRTGARWKDLPTFLPSPSTCWRRFKVWTEDGVFLEAWQRLLEHLDRRKLVVWSEAFGDGTFCPAKKSADVGKTKRGKGTKLMLLVDGNGLPLALDRTSASPADRADLSASQEPCKTSDARRACIAAISTPLESRTHHQLVVHLSSPGSTV